VSEKAIYLHHERDTMANLFSDLGTRELGYGDNIDYLGFKDEDSNERWRIAMSVGFPRLAPML
jgi:hypothetical protein